ncbi:hypothetical protein Q7C36_023537 [Tachysurus vachellii]|uniref:Uncharacterized protein n=1 Tax=Tachysurus vachellii TaxID=175792 RepID=A0AA88IMJ7_TACVA|nr:hypothetical protein Q7C36_023537 [Tachysurus vachellii]
MHEMESIQRGVSQSSKAINARRATEAAALQHSWASLEHHRGHLCTFHQITREHLLHLKD